MGQYFESLPTPCYVVDEGALLKNCQILQNIAQRSGCKILLAQKAFSMFAVYPLLKPYLAGTTASGLFEAKLGFTEMGGETHVFCAAYPPQDFAELLQICDHFSFNSFSQWQQYGQAALKAGKSCGIRINPEYSTQDHGIYDPCALGSRLGVTRAQFRPNLLSGIQGFHFHTLCQQNADALIATVQAVEEQFGAFLPQMQWVNFGGGHHITRSDYDRDALVQCIRSFQEKYKVQVYLEPGEAVALNAGYLVATVLDLVKNGSICNALLDASAACHMPDVIEMPYRPPLMDSGAAGELPYTYRLGGATCLAGDIIGDYSFAHPLQIGDRLLFADMAIYSMVKNNTFNGMCLPALGVLTQNGETRLIKSFGYADFKNRLS